MNDSEPTVERADRPARTYLFYALKVAVAVLLIWWLVRSDRLDFGKVKILISSPEVFCVTVANWLVVAFGLSTLRWLCILRIDGARLGFLRGAGLQTTALFFNSLIPGNLGGDFIKNHAAVRGPGGRLVALVLVERVIGVITLVWATAFGLAIHAGRILSEPALRQLGLLVVVLLVGSLLGPWLVSLWLGSAAESRFEASAVPATGARAFVLRQVQAMKSVLRLVKGAPGWLALTIAVSLAMHLFNIAYFFYLTRLLGNPDVTYADIALIFPVGMLSLVIPVSVSGFGVGHVLFGALFGMMGLVSGATIFNVYIIGHIAMSFLGVIPLLWPSRSKQVV